MENFILIFGFLGALAFALIIAKLIKLKIDKAYRVHYQRLVDDLGAVWTFNESGNPAICGDFRGFKYHITIADFTYILGADSIDSSHDGGRLKRRFFLEFPVLEKNKFLIHRKPYCGYYFRSYPLKEPITVQSLLLELDWSSDNESGLRHYLQSNAHDQVLAELFTSGMERFRIQDGRASLTFPIYYAPEESSRLSLPPPTIDEIVSLLEKARCLL